MFPALGAWPWISVGGFSRNPPLFSSGSESDWAADASHRVEGRKTLVLGTDWDGGNWVSEDALSRFTGGQ